jgi:PadR family transcriptional regulator PadR
MSPCSWTHGQHRLDASPIEVYDCYMAQKAAHTHTPGRQAVDYTNRAYWNGLIKMSLSKFFILCVLQTRPMHGYEITRAVERTTNGCCSPAEGTVYPVLREFEQGGYVTARTEVVQGRQRKVYAITDRGRTAFQVAVEAWMEVTQCLVQNECVTGESIASGARSR